MKNTIFRHIQWGGDEYNHIHIQDLVSYSSSEDGEYFIVWTEKGSISKMIKISTDYYNEFEIWVKLFTYHSFSMDFMDKINKKTITSYMKKKKLCNVNGFCSECHTYGCKHCPRNKNGGFKNEDEENTI